MSIDLGFDESGAGDTLLVTMQLSITEQAKKLCRQWRKCLREVGVEYFHGCEFDDQTGGVFAGLDRTERKQLLYSLCRINERHTYIGMTGRASISRYNEKTTPEFRSRWGAAYSFIIQMLVVCGYMFAERIGLRPEFHVLIEDGHRNAGQAIEILRVTQKSGIAFEIPSRILSYRLGSKADHPILQSADMLAYSEWQNLNNADATVYSATHGRGLRFQPELIDFDNELTDIIVDNAKKWLARRKEWGARKYGRML